MGLPFFALPLNSVYPPRDALSAPCLMSKGMNPRAATSLLIFAAPEFWDPNRFLQPPLHRRFVFFCGGISLYRPFGIPAFSSFLSLLRVFALCQSWSIPLNKSDPFFASAPRLGPFFSHPADFWPPKPPRSGFGSVASFFLFAP